jgi:hypothetical protein
MLISPVLRYPDRPTPICHTTERGVFAAVIAFARREGDRSFWPFGPVKARAACADGVNDPGHISVGSVKADLRRRRVLALR